MTYFGARSFLASLLIVAILKPSAGYSQSLDEAIENQLGKVGLVQCSVLLDSGTVAPSSALTGALLGICDQPVTTPGGGPSNSTGGGATTPSALPSMVQQRLRELRGEETKPETQGASADSVVEYASGLGIFISAEYQSLDRDVTTFEDGYDSDIWRATAGADYQFTERIAAGLAFDYSRQVGDFDSVGGFDIDSYGVLGFGSFLPFDPVFVQVTAGYTRKDYDRDRIATFTQREPPPSGAVTVSTDGQVDADYNADEVSVGALVGYEFEIGNVTIGPRGGFDYFDIDFETYSDTGNTGLELTYHDDELTSLQSRLGVQASVAFTTGLGVVVPQVSIDWIHEFENDQRDIEVSFVEDTRSKRFTYESDKPDRDFFDLNVGFIVDLPYGILGYGNYSTLLGHSFFDSHAGTIGLLVSF